MMDLIQCQTDYTNNILSDTSETSDDTSDDSTNDSANDSTNDSMDDSLPKITSGEVLSNTSNYHHTMTQHIGGRRTMEDRNVCNVIVQSRYRMYGVFDGHGGVEAADYTAQHIADRLNGIDLDSDLSIIQMIERFDQEILSENLSSGTTAAIVLLDTTSCRAIAINIGDSNIVMFDALGNNHLTIKQHNFSNQDESQRIAEKQFNSKIMLKNSRVYLESGWSINVSRSLGDAKYKVDDVLTCRPDIYRFDVSPDHLIIIASDGLVNNLRIPDTEIGTRYIQHNHRVRELVKQAVKCIAGDNVTVICISL